MTDGTLLAATHRRRNPFRTEEPNVWWNVEYVGSNNSLPAAEAHNGLTAGLGLWYSKGRDQRKLRRLAGESPVAGAKLATPIVVGLMAGHGLADTSLRSNIPHPSPTGTGRDRSRRKNVRQAASSKVGAQSHPTG
jgi:hypothetical protein